MKTFRLSVVAIVLIAALTVTPSAALAGWSVPEKITASPDDKLAVQAAAYGAGNVLALWGQYDGVYAIRYTAGVASGEPEKLAGQVGSYVAVNSSGSGFIFLKRENLHALRYTAASGWEEPEQIGNIGWTPGYFQVAVDPFGNTIAVWTDPSGGEHRSLFAQRYTAGQGWGAPETVGSHYLTHQPEDPRIVMDENGNAIVAWHQFSPEGSPPKVWVNRYSPASGWGTQELITGSADGNDRVGSLSVALNNSGDAVVVWSRYGYAVRGRYTYWPRDVYANYYTPADGWSDAVLLHSSPYKVSSWLKAAMDPGGNALAVWHMQGGPNELEPYVPDAIYSSYYSPHSGWGARETVRSGVDKWPYVGEPHLVMDGEGNAFLAWGVLDYSEEGFTDNSRFANWIESSRFTAGSGWGEPDFVSAAGSHRRYKLALTQDVAGTRHLVWIDGERIDENTVMEGIWTSRYCGGGKEALAIFDPGLGSVNISQVAVEGTPRPFGVQLKRAPGEKLAFTLASKSRTDGCCPSASYDPASGVLRIPQLEVGKKTFDVALEKRPGPDFVFSVTSCTKLP